MPLTTAGRDVIAAMILGESTTDFTAANARIGVGDSTTAFAASQTDLQAATNRLRKAMNSTYPQRSTNVLTFQATFLEAEAVYTWNEWAIFNAGSGGTMLNRRVEALGTKPNTEQWRLTCTLTITAA